jgi:hypothetical protein
MGSCFTYTGVNLSTDKSEFSGLVMVGFFNSVKVSLVGPNSKFKYSTLIRGNNNIRISNYNKVDITPVATYPNVENLKDTILKENSKKAGVYI